MTQQLSMMAAPQQSQPSTQNATTAVARPMDALKTMLNAPSVQAQFKNALGDHKDAFVASLIDLYTGDKSLQTCQPKDVVAQALRAAVMKLPINKALGFAYIVVYNNSVKTGVDPQTGRDIWQKVPTPTFIPGYKGYIQLAMRTGQYKTINADVVYEGELQKVDKLSGEIRFDGQKVSDKIVGYFAFFELLNGFRKTLYMSVEEMATYAKKYSPSVKKDTTAEQLSAKAMSEGTSKKTVGWEGNFNDMATKTVLRRLLSKYGYLSVEMENALSSEINAETKAQEDRDALIAQEANMQTVTYEEVDLETGEIKSNTDEASGPNY